MGVLFQVASGVYKTDITKRVLGGSGRFF